jgi:hypothetical protein
MLLLLATGLYHDYKLLSRTNLTSFPCTAVDHTPHPVTTKKYRSYRTTITRSALPLQLVINILGISYKLELGQIFPCMLTGSARHM